MINLFLEECISFDADEDTIQYFTNDQCNALAYRIHKLTGWTLAILTDSGFNTEFVMAHAFVIDSQGLAVDITGRHFLEDFRRTWDFLPHIHRFFSLKEYEQEMTLWNNKVHYKRDHEAKLWAKHIVDILM